MQIDINYKSKNNTASSAPSVTHSKEPLSQAQRFFKSSIQNICIIHMSQFTEICESHTHLIRSEKLNEDYFESKRYHFIEF